MCYLVTWMHEHDHPEFHTKCRKCLECRQERAREWGLRNAFESEEHEKGCFITLTYSDEYYPGHLVKKHLQDFKKRLRKSIGVVIKTFDCGEYGSKNYRAHYHMLIHGYNFPDKYVERKSNRGYDIYNSPRLEKVWGMGLVTVQDLTLNAAAYCALYAAKPTKYLPEELQPYPEFNTMSKSLGMKKILENMETYLLTDEIFYEGKRYRIPQSALDKYFNKHTVTEKRIVCRSVARGTPLNVHYEDVYGTEERERVVIDDPLGLYAKLKERRRERGESIWQAQLAQVSDPVEMYSQKQYRAEQRQKRLQKSI